ncbi:MAG: hypothetical protein BHW64_02815 [Candidatus Melainabacteria bacterium LEY3_CP_29_8]|nr:MAG: hypothetical protein BHW64_02815 [Candidatus Melainabacteria bacterium LEY3_CP_29_8]
MFKRIKTLLNTISEVIQVFLYFYAFFAIIVWLLYLSHCSLSESLNYYFLLFESIVKKFYTPSGVDWTLIIVAVLCIVISYLLSKITENVNMLIDNINSLIFDILEKKDVEEEKKARNDLRQSYLKYNQFVVGIKIKIQVNEHQVYESLSQLEVSKLHSDIVAAIRKYIDESTIKSFSTIGDCIILRSKSFSEIEDYIESINNLAHIIKTQYSNDEYFSSIKCYIEPLKPESEINRDFIVKILNMNLTPRFITNEKFHEIYNEFGLKKFKILTIGLYKIDDENSKISKNIELYQIK